jgi:site-specific DNA-methyltransferase (adenine-specific)
MRELPDASVDAVVTDPPYELGFMGKSWDSSGIAFNTDVWAECLRVLKPGGHLLAFGGSRTWHRIAVAVEDAGFQIRDSVAWLYGSGFPKSLDVSKAIDKAAGVEFSAKPATGVGFMNSSADGYNTTLNQLEQVGESTAEAVKWQGWGTALKPAFEPVIVARKPLVGTVAANVLEFGTGALNIDGTRIGTEGGTRDGDFIAGTNSAVNSLNASKGGKSALKKGVTVAAGLGRWPSNVVLDEFTAGLVDEQSGVSKSTPSAKKDDTHSEDIYGKGLGNWSGSSHNDSGGASRFFYVAKASKRDRNEGLDDIEAQSIGAKGNGLARTCATCGSSVLDGCECPNRTFTNPTRQNFHPTVKPTDLMRQLVRLVTPPGGVVLDPFTGSGSTGKAAILEGFEFIGCELTEEYLPIIEGRLNHAVASVKAQADKEQEKLF